MTDAIDKGCEFEEQHRARSLKAQAAKPKMEPVGFCYNCDETLFTSDLPADEAVDKETYLRSLGCFCNTECRDDYEKRERAERLKG